MADLERFVEAQEPVFAAVLRELAAGRKGSHWMWFVFPQIAGLGTSATARFFALASLDEARAYLAHPLLASRLREATRLVLRHSQKTALDVFGSPDAMKFRSSMTLFSAAEPGEPLFSEALRTFFGGEPDASTLGRLGMERLGGNGP